MDRLVRRQTIFVAKLTVVLRWLTWIKKEPPLCPKVRSTIAFYSQIKVR